MEEAIRFLEDTPFFSALDQWSLRYIAGLAVRKKYGANEWLFHEFTPWRSFGIVEKGEVSIVRNMRDRQVCQAVVRQGGILGEDVLLDYRLHSAGGFTRNGAVVLQFSRAAVARLRKDHPRLYYQIVARISRMVSDQLCNAGKTAAGVNAGAERTVGGESTIDTWSILRRKWIGLF